MGVGIVHPEGRTSCRIEKYREMSYEVEDKYTESTDYSYGDPVPDEVYTDPETGEVTRIHHETPLITTFSRKHYQRLKTIQTDWEEDTCDPGIRKNPESTISRGEWILVDEDISSMSTTPEPYVTKLPGTPDLGAEDDIAKWTDDVNKEIARNKRDIKQFWDDYFERSSQERAPFAPPTNPSGKTGVEERRFGFKTSDSNLNYLSAGPGMNARDVPVYSGIIGSEISWEAIQNSAPVNGYTSPIPWDKGYITDIIFNPQTSKSYYDDVHQRKVTVTYGWFRILIDTLQ